MLNDLLTAARERGLADERELLMLCLRNSSRTCLKRYSKPRMGANAAIEFLDRHGHNFPCTPAQVRVLGKLLDWRDRMARKEDESPGFIASPRCMLALTRHTPSTRGGVLSFVPSPVSPVLIRSAKEISRLIKSAVEGKE